MTPDQKKYVLIGAAILVAAAIFAFTFQPILLDMGCRMLGGSPVHNIHGPDAWCRF